MENEEQIIETDEGSFDDFFSEFNDGESDGNQTGSVTEENETEETGDDASHEDEADGESDENESGEESEGEETEPAEGEEKPDKEPEEKPEDTFTLKVNKEEKTVSRDEVIALAQKGADYDRVKGQVETARAENQKLQQQLDDLNQYSDAIGLLKQLSESSGKPVGDFVHQIRVNMKVKGGATAKEAEALIRAEDAERAAEALKSAPKDSTPSPDERAMKEVQEFRERFPDVEITQELMGKIASDVQSGTSLANAYQKMLDADAKKAQDEAQARIKELEIQLEAEKKNKENRASSPGSMKDSGGRRKPSEFDEFFSEFNR